MEQILTKLIGILTEPVQLILLLGCLYLILDKSKLYGVIDKQAETQQEVSTTLTKISTMVEFMARETKGGNP